MKLEFTIEQLLSGRINMPRPPLTESIELTIPRGIDPDLVLDDRNWIDVDTYGSDFSKKTYISAPKIRQIKWRSD